MDRRQRTMPMFYDTHAHLDFPDFAPDLAAVLERAVAAGIEKIITIGTDLAISARAVELAERFAGVYAAVGRHPGHASVAPEDLRPGLRELARHPQGVALGATGLDCHHLARDGPDGSGARQAGVREEPA